MTRTMVDVRHADRCGGRVGTLVDGDDGPALTLTYRPWQGHPSNRVTLPGWPLAQLSPTSAVFATCPRHGWVHVRVADLLDAVDEYWRTGRRQVLAVRSDGMLTSR